MGFQVDREKPFISILLSSMRSIIQKIASKLEVKEVLLLIVQF
jgi:hypothetical protein